MGFMVMPLGEVSPCRSLEPDRGLSQGLIVWIVKPLLNISFNRALYSPGTKFTQLNNLVFSFLSFPLIKAWIPIFQTSH